MVLVQPGVAVKGLSNATSTAAGCRASSRRGRCSAAVSPQPTWNRFFTCARRHSPCHHVAGNLSDSFCQAMTRSSSVKLPRLHPMLTSPIRSD